MTIHHSAWFEDQAESACHNEEAADRGGRRREVRVEAGLLAGQPVAALAILALGALDLEAHLLGQAARDEAANAVRFMPMSA